MSRVPRPGTRTPTPKKIQRALDKFHVGTCLFPLSALLYGSASQYVKPISTICIAISVLLVIAAVVTYTRTIEDLRLLGKNICYTPNKKIERDMQKRIKHGFVAFLFLVLCAFLAGKIPVLQSTIIGLLVTMGLCLNLWRSNIYANLYSYIAKGTDKHHA